MGVPSILLAIGFVWMPYESMSMSMRMLTVLLFNIGFQFFFSFFYDSYENLIYVLSPNTQERTDVSAIKAVIYSIAPSITGIVMPLAAKFLTNGDMTNMKLYRFAYPPMLIIGILLVILVYANTQEKNHPSQNACRSNQVYGRFACRGKKINISGSSPLPGG